MLICWFWPWLWSHNVVFWLNTSESELPVCLIWIILWNGLNYNEVAVVNIDIGDILMVMVEWRAIISMYKEGSISSFEIFSIWNDFSNDHFSLCFDETAWLNFYIDEFHASNQDNDSQNKEYIRSFLNILSSILQMTINLLIHVTMPF